MIDEVSQCPRLFQREGSWRPETMTSGSSISLRARDFYAGRYSWLCVEKKAVAKANLKLSCFLLIILCQPVAWHQATV